MTDWVALARPRQWTKNLLLFAAFLFTAGDAWGMGDDMGEAGALFLRASLGFAAFCLLSSAGYLLNDARDAGRDRTHPRKRERPIAAGRISARAAYRVGGMLALVGLAAGAPLGAEFRLVALAYLAGTGAYTLWLKRLPVVDVAVVAGLFALRAVAGASAIEVDASPWIVICTFSGAAFVAAVKRQQETWLMGGEATLHRESVSATARWPRALAILAAGSTVVGYALYTQFAENVPADGLMVVTLPFVVLAVARYWQVARRRPDRDADEIAFRDPVVLALVVSFVVVAVVVGSA
ncbi:MAG: hypothetical protein DWG80_00745 [Chloroflexi bacterium]|nr:hypothetical protein [Chloroflexota bacterium]